MKKRYIIIGDCHGCLNEAQQLLKKLNHNKDEDILISLGDLVDRGPDPAGCIDLFRSLDAKLVLGNHEDKLLRWRAKEILFNSGATSKPNDIRLRDQHKASVNSIEEHRFTEALWQYLEDAKVFITFSVGDVNYICVHGGLLPFKGILTPKREAIRLRNLDDSWKKAVSKKPGDPSGPDMFWASAWAGPEVAIFGHAVFSDVSEYPYAVGIDTGCAFGGKLTAAVINIETGIREYVSVQAKKTYWDYHGDFIEPNRV